MEEDAAEQERYQEGIQAAQQPPVAAPKTQEVQQVQEPQDVQEAPREFREGDTVTFPSGDSVTLHSYTSPVQSEERFWQPQPGKQFATIDVEGCAGSSAGNGYATLNPFYFSLQMPDNTRLGLTIPAVIRPDLNHTNLEPGECVRGFVSFQVPQGTTPSYVHMGSSMRVSITGPRETAKWAVQ